MSTVACGFDTHYVKYVVIMGDLICADDFSSLQVIDNQDATCPTLVGGYDTLGESTIIGSSS